MNASGPVLVYRWPEKPALPPCGQPVLVRAPVARARPDARPGTIRRMVVRGVLREVLAVWSGLEPERLPLEETPRGPVWRGQLSGLALDISLSYCADEAWIGLIRGGWIGIDVALVEVFPDSEDVARCYLGPSAAADVRATARPARALATAWTERESRLKCLKHGLIEWTAAQAEMEADCLCHRLVLNDHLVGAVTWKKQAVGSRQ